MAGFVPFRPWRFFVAMLRSCSGWGVRNSCGVRILLMESRFHLLGKTHYKREIGFHVCIGPVFVQVL